MSAVGCLALASCWNSLAVALAAVLFLGTGCGLPYAALFTPAVSLYPARAGAPLVGHFTDWSGSFRSSFLALGAFALLACAAVGLVSRDEPSSTL